MTEAAQKPGFGYDWAARTVGGLQPLKPSQSLLGGPDAGPADGLSGASLPQSGARGGVGWRAKAQGVTVACGVSPPFHSA